MGEVKEKIDYCCKTTAIELLEISKSQFEKLSLQPDKKVPNPHYRSSSPMLLFVKDKIIELSETDKIKKLQEEKLNRQCRRKDYFSIFNKRYDSPESAIKDACDGMFNLNRYAKHSSCTKSNKEEIYTIKNEYVKFLYKAGYVDTVVINKQVIPAKPCFKCDGTGEYYGFYDEYEEAEYIGTDICPRCDGTGIYLEEKELYFTCFSFLIEGERYTWHQPREQIDFEYSLTDNSNSIIDKMAEKPLYLSKSKLKEKKELIKWVINKFETEES